VSNSVTAAIAIAAAAAAALALLAAVLAWLQLKGVRSSQQVMLGGGKDDLVDFAVSLQARIDDLHRAVDEVAAGLARVDRRVGRVPGEDLDRPLRRLRRAPADSSRLPSRCSTARAAASSSARSRAAITRAST
jgi:hypothetical protein